MKSWFRRLRRGSAPLAATVAAAKLDTAPWSHLIDSSGFWLLTFHVRITPWRSLLVTNVPGIDAIHRHALRPGLCFANSISCVGLDALLTLNRPSTFQSVMIPPNVAASK